MLKYDLINNNKQESIVLLHAYGGNSRCFKKQIPILSKFFNIVLIDMHGHGKSSNIDLNSNKSEALKIVVEEIHKILIYLKIKKAHFMGLSLGTIVANTYALYYPNHVLSILNAGAVIKFKPVIRLLLKSLYIFKGLLPHKMVYSIAGRIIMPQKSHSISREIFIREAKKMNRNNFYNWAKILINFETKYNFKNLNISEITYISGDDDYFFINEVEKYCKEENINFHTLKNAGHICNIDNDTEFNIFLENHYSNILKNIDIA